MCGAKHNARFLAKALYTIKLVLLEKQHNLFTTKSKSFQLVAKFICCYYAQWYLESHEAPKAIYFQCSCSNINAKVKFKGRSRRLRPRAHILDDPLGNPYDVLKVPLGPPYGP